MPINPKIGAQQSPQMPYEYDNALNMHILGPGEPALSEWQDAGLVLPDMVRLRSYRLERVRNALRKRDCAGIVLFDPLNIRYATDSTNMQLWITHNAARYCFIATDGPVIVFDYHQCEHLSSHNPLIDEVRSANSWFYFSSGDRLPEDAKRWAKEIADLIHSHGGGNKRLAVDKLNPTGASILNHLGIDILCGEELMEHARMIKSEDEIRALRCAMNACEKAMDVMRTHAISGVTENRLWSYLHAENIARGGEWIETRLLSAGPRTNPWFQESSSRPIQEGELMAFDTDLIGPYGMCVDISRTWFIGDGHPTPQQKELMEMAITQVRHNSTLIQPGISWKELSQKSLTYSKEEYYHYSSLYHGVGLCDEYPSVSFPWSWKEGDDNVVHEGMMLCVESYVGKKSGGEGAKFEEQVLVTKDGIERLSFYPDSF